MSRTVVQIYRLRPETSHLVPGLLDMFAMAFDDAKTYSANRAYAAYLKRLLANDSVFT